MSHEMTDEPEISGEDRWRVVIDLLTQLEDCRTKVMGLMNEPGPLPLATYTQQMRAIAHAINKTSGAAFNYTNSATITMNRDAGRRGAK